MPVATIFPFNCALSWLVFVRVLGVLVSGFVVCVCACELIVFGNFFVFYPRSAVSGERRDFPSPKNCKEIFRSWPNCVPPIG